jgi:hypothetical protein
VLSSVLPLAVVVVVVVFVDFDNDDDDGVVDNDDDADDNGDDNSDDDNECSMHPARPQPYFDKLKQNNGFVVFLCQEPSQAPAGHRGLSHLFGNFAI